MQAMQAAKGTALIHDCIPLFGPVGNRKKGNTGTAEILQGLDRMVDGHLGKEAGTRIEDMHFFHGVNNIYMLSNWAIKIIIYKH